MNAFNGSEELKKEYVNKMLRHAQLDNIVQGQGWDNGKGCFIGCSFEEYKHENFKSIGLPLWLAKLADKIFEGLSGSDAQIFAKDFYTKINVGANLEKIKIPFLIFVCESVLDHVRVDDKFIKQKLAINDVIFELKRESIDFEKLLNAASDAYAASNAYATYPYYSYTAYFAADAVANVSVADAVADAAYYAADTVCAHARKNKYKLFADKLFELFENEKEGGK